MKQFDSREIEKSPRISRLIDRLFEKMPVIESARAILFNKILSTDRGRTNDCQES